MKTKKTTHRSFHLERVIKKIADTQRPVVFAVYYQSADSYHSTPQLPTVVFDDLDTAIAYIDKQEGYGLGADWFILVLPFRCEPNV